MSDNQVGAICTAAVVAVGLVCGTVLLCWRIYIDYRLEKEKD